MLIIIDTLNRDSLPICSHVPSPMPPKIELSESLGEPADLDVNDPEEGSDDPRGWWRLPPAGEDRERALQAHKNAVDAHENRDKWFYASVPEDASTVGIDIRKAGQPNVPWPFPSNSTIFMCSWFIKKARSGRREPKIR